MRLHALTRMEAELLLATPEGAVCGMTVVEGAAPPPFLLERVLAANSTAWDRPRLFVDEVSGEVVGSACFKGAPKERTVEIGYGVAPLRGHRGFATTGAGLMVAEAFASGEVDVVLASALPGNAASVRVLEKLHFVRYGEAMDEEGRVDLWRLEKAESRNRPNRRPI